MSLPFVRLSTVGDFEVLDGHEDRSEEILEEKLRQIQLSTLKAKKRLRKNFDNVKRHQNIESHQSSPKKSERDAPGDYSGSRNGREALVDVINSMEVYEKEVRARLHAKSKSAPKSFWSDTDSDNAEVTDGECTAEDIENNEVESDRKNEPDGESSRTSSEDDNSEMSRRNFESAIRMRMKVKSPNYSKPIDLYSEAKKIEREKIEKRLKWEQRKELSRHERQKSREIQLRKKLSIQAKNQQIRHEEERRRIEAENCPEMTSNDLEPNLVDIESTPAFPFQPIEKRIAGYREKTTDLLCGCPINHRVGCWNFGSNSLKPKITKNSQIIYL